ncbi:MAG: hypothetical protein M0Z56_03695 [Desulfobacteraceae bacterium]|nr:hypothetical protein [Desulfobacteraceae bacterium]
MSAILEALKKLEQETLDPSGHPLRPEINRHGKQRGIFLAGALAAGVILCGLAGYGVVVLKRIAPVSNASVSAVSAIDQRAALSNAAEPHSQTARQSRIMQPVPAPQPRQTEIPAMPVASRTGEKAEPPAPEGKIIALALDQEKPPEEPSKETDATAVLLPAETIPEAKNHTGGASGPSTPSGVVLEIIDDPGTVLQAISWSQDTSRRLAVINGKICRETEQMNGYVILTINPEDVVVSKGSVTGRLVFKIH